MKQALRLILVASFCGGVVVTAQAQQFIYKWTDAQGMVQYTELVPPAGIKYEMVRKPAGLEVSPGARDLNKDQAALAKDAEEQDKQEKEKMEKAEKDAQDVRSKNCEIAKKNVAALQGDSPVFRTDAKGEKVILDAEGRAAELKKAQTEQDRYCNPEPTPQPDTSASTPSSPTSPSPTSPSPTADPKPNP